MFKEHPKGLFVAFFANMGERFSYYTMLAIFVLYLQAKFGFSAGQAGDYYGGFLFGIYFLPILGGIIADRYGYGKTIIWGLIIAFLGKIVLTAPGFLEEGLLNMEYEIIEILDLANITPQGLTIARDYLWVTDGSTDHLYKYDFNGSLVETENT
jgi:dipeptide/tripeptide permease